MVWTGNGVIADAGSGPTSLLSTLGVTASGGTPFCIQDALSGPYTEFCIGVLTGTAITVLDQALGGATHTPIQFTVNGNNSLTVTDTGILVNGSPISSGGVSTVSVVSANGFAGTVANPTTTPAITLSTTLTAAVVKANGTAFVAATAGSDYPGFASNNTFSGQNNFTGFFQIGGTTQTFPASGLIVGTTDTQTLTNKSIGGGEINSGTVAVSYGGTGANSFTANLPLIGNGTGAIAQGTRSGTTTVFGTVSGSFTANDCLSINASGNIIDAGGPCTTGGGGGTVTSGSANSLGYYASSGTVISGLATADSGVLVTSNSGVPSISTTLPSALTIPSASMTGSTTFAASGILLLGSSTGYTTFASANAGATNYTLTFPAANDTVVTLAATQTLTNKSIAGSEINSSLVGATYGGTGISNPTAHYVMVAEGSSAMTPISPTTNSGYVLTSNGTGSDPTFQAVGAGALPGYIKAASAASLMADFGGI